MNNKQAKKLRKAANLVSLIQKKPISEIHNEMKQIHKSLTKNEKFKIKKQP